MYILCASTVVSLLRKNPVLWAMLTGRFTDWNRKGGKSTTALYFVLSLSTRCSSARLDIIATSLSRWLSLLIGLLWSILLLYTVYEIWDFHGDEDPYSVRVLYNIRTDESQDAGKWVNETITDVRVIGKAVSYYGDYVLVL